MHRIPQNGDEWLTLTVSIVDPSSETPLRCLVVLQGDEHAPSNGQMICFLSLTVSSVGDDQPQTTIAPTRNLEPAYHCQRSKYTPNGKATFQLCFFQADANYIIRESVDSLCRDGADAQYMQYLSKSRITSPQIR